MRIKRRKKPKKQKKVKQPDVKPPIDTIQEQIEAPMTTIHCPQSVKENNLKEVKRHPEQYIEINIIKKIRVVDTFYIDATNKVFQYKERNHEIVEENIYLLPTKSGFFIPTIFYYEDNIKPTSFKQLNEGITSKALSLLYDEDLYIDLFSGDESKYNLFVVIFSIITLASFGIGCYFLFTGGV